MPLRRPSLVLALLAGAAVPLAAVPLAAQSPAAAAAPADTAADRRAVEATITRLFDAMRARDTAAMRATFVPGATLATTGTSQAGVPTARFTPIDEFLKSVGSAPADVVLDERIYGVRVQVSDNLASAWMEYDLYVGPRFSHCGVDAAHLARTAEGWRFVALADTRRREGCPTR
jgi:hypothetical protein